MNTLMVNFTSFVLLSFCFIGLASYDDRVDKCNPIYKDQMRVVWGVSPINYVSAVFRRWQKEILLAVAIRHVCTVVVCRECAHVPS